MDTKEDNTTAGSLTTSAACSLAVRSGEYQETVRLEASVILDKDVMDRIGKAMDVLKDDKDIAMHGIEVRYDCNSVTASDNGEPLAICRLRVERTYYNGSPELTVMFDASHSLARPIPSLSQFIEPSSCQDQFTYLVQYAR